VKLKMARNSLFAILLRSPWWISFVVVLVFAAGSAALLPPQYVVFGLMGALPFCVIGTVAAYRQFRAPSEKRVDETLQQVAAMPWREFCETLEQAFAAKGYQVSRIDSGAADLELRKGGQTTLVAARRWKASSHGVEPLRALDRERQSKDASHCVYVTLAALSDTTRRFAEKQAIEMLNGVALVQLLGTLRRR
jgi:restriction system protein